MTSFNPNYFIHTANVLLLVAYSVRDILWLRLFAVGASLISLPYFVLQPTPQWPPIAWSVVFAEINSFQSWRLYLQTASGRADTPTRRRFAGSRLRNCRLARYCNLSASGSGPPRLPGERLIEHGTPTSSSSPPGSGGWSCPRWRDARRRPAVRPAPAPRRQRPGRGRRHRSRRRAPTARRRCRRCDPRRGAALRGHRLPRPWRPSHDP